MNLPPQTGLLPLSACQVLAGRTRAKLLAAIETGAILWAWNLARRADGPLGLVRVSAESLAAWQADGGAAVAGLGPLHHRPARGEAGGRGGGATGGEAGGPEDTAALRQATSNGARGQPCQAAGSSH